MLQTLLLNSLIALLVATVAWLVQRRWKRPELLHLLWLVVLVKLITPGHFELQAIPLPTSGLPAQIIELPGGPPPGPIGPTELSPSASRSAASPLATPRLSDWLTPLLALGALIFFGWSLSGAWRFSRLLRHARPFSPALQRRLDRQATLLGVRPPRGLSLEARIPPMLWGRPYRPDVILPQQLIEQLGETELDSLLMHELVHLKRGDGWVRWLELIVLSACWWNPLAWWARSNLRSAEEQACDAQVLRLMPEARRRYADAILKTMEFLAGNRPTPALATGVDGTRDLKERLTMILDRTQKRFRSPALPWLMIGLLALPIVPGFAERDDRAEKREVEEQAERKHERAMVELERRQMELERQMMEIELQREELERSMETMHLQRQEMELKRHASELRRDGQQREAEQLMLELEKMRERVAHEHAMRDQMRNSQRMVVEQEREMREKLIALEHARARQDAEAVESYERALAEQKRALSKEVKASQLAEQHYEKAMMKQAMQDMEQQLKQLAEMEREASDDERAEIRAAREKLTAEIERLTEELTERRGRGR